MCKLVSKAWRERHTVYIHADSQAQADGVDDLLWTFQDISFVPHQRALDSYAAETRVLVGHTQPPTDFDDVLVNLAASVPGFYGQFKRVLEVIDSTPETKNAGRKRYRYYQTEGHTPSTHNIGSENG